MESNYSKDVFTRAGAKSLNHPVLFLDESLQVFWMNPVAAKILYGGADYSFPADLAEILDSLGLKLDEIGEVLGFIEDEKSKIVQLSADRWNFLQIQFPDRDFDSEAEFVITFQGLDISYTMNELLAGESEKLRVAVVDDNPISLEIASRLLARLGYNAKGFLFAEELLKAHEEARFHLVLTDLLMPDVDGLEICRRLKLPDGEGDKKVKIIAITSGVSSADPDRCREVGMDGYLSKPVTTANLAKAIDFALSGKDFFHILNTVTVEDYIEDEYPLINRDEWEDDPGLHRRMLKLLFDESEKAIDDIEVAWAEMDAKRFEESVHYFKGSVDVVRADRLSEICGRILAFTRAREMSRSKPFLPELRKTLSKTRAYAIECGLLENE